MRRLLVSLIAAAALAMPAAGALAQATAPILTAPDLGAGWTSTGAETRTVTQGNVYRDVFTAPSDYPDGTGVALQVVQAASDEVRDGLVGQIMDTYGVQGYQFAGETTVGDQGVVGTLNSATSTSTMYLYTVGNTVVMVVVGTGQPNYPGLDDLALNLAKLQAQRLS